MHAPRMQIVVASRNKHKVAEIQTLLGDLPVQLIAVDAIAPDVELIEEEPTFEANALVKAQQAAAATGLPAIADDSGLEVDALQGAPGVRSARYAGTPCDDGANNVKLLQALQGVREPRTGRYQCCAAFVDPARQLSLVCAGACEGLILTAPQGSGGFGYDPLFFLPPLGKTMAEIDLQQKNRLSHRAAAFLALAKALRPHLPPPI